VAIVTDFALSQGGNPTFDTLAGGVPFLVQDIDVDYFDNGTKSSSIYLLNAPYYWDPTYRVVRFDGGIYIVSFTVALL